MHLLAGQEQEPRRISTQRGAHNSPQLLDGPSSPPPPPPLKETESHLIQIHTHSLVRNDPEIIPCVNMTRAFLSLRSSPVPQLQKHSSNPLSAIATPPHASCPSSYLSAFIYIYLENSIHSAVDPLLLWLICSSFREMELREIGFTLPPGFRFHPNDHELVCHYLSRKVSDQERTMVEVDLHVQEPWELPDAAKLGADEWYFFSFRDRKYATGSRTNRATKSGYWKATGKDRAVSDPATGAAVGMRKTLVFYRGRAPNGAKTNWVMHEFRLETPRSAPKEDWVLCRVFEKRKGERDQGGESATEGTPTSSRWGEEEWLGLLLEWGTMENGARAGEGGILTV
ncbi:uncharacterized protein LOC122016187 [Zingiber officinale]|uniref:uncharacterized protein LOC122016187 n=1 Tax=Zingiber officinale TaxID=94328 RepID=UPI001C4AEEB6|nr:uncharacterized protein LOC122016187 [Zingiber officinale]XP_042429351.1 uncharacterized protein LOC122016187 [Zingiber officinale]XP_042429352.1 uncharacterized protein LOC122016187 [Zingiber officinale]XP_042429354.1 uncharacterized protein LOC122016187 [Zingiber officinale]XP_042429355.1 uncharacterized protein LOC122016187 [Zingiber officinale]XP_042429356.1 uncharacterized protein LOC122016187 [Zingiber officinale]